METETKLPSFICHRAGKFRKEKTQRVEEPSATAKKIKRKRSRNVLEGLRTGIAMRDKGVNCSWR